MEFVDWDKLDIPKFVYKYRDWKAPFHKTIITERKVFFSPPKEFPDLIDCKNNIRYDLLTGEEIRWSYYNDSKTKTPHLGEEYHRKFADEWYAKSPLLDEEFIKRHLEKDFLAYNERLGILSLTTNPSNIKMWELYGSNHTGFCVGFTSKSMFPHLRGAGSAINYCDELPIIKPYPWEDRITQTYKQIYFKLEEYDFEEEYRTHNFSYYPLTIEQRTIALPQEAYYEIIFGAAMKQESRAEIIKISQHTIPNIKFREVLISGPSISIRDFIDV